jgi:hypothetical protein
MYDLLTLMIQQHYTSGAVKKTQSEIYAGKAVLFIWVSGIFCALAVILFLLLANQKSGNILAANETTAAKSGKPRTLDNILLSSEDAFFADNKTFVNAALRYNAEDSKLAVNVSDSSRTNLYNNIFRDRLNRARQQPKGDFSVGPVPQ